MASFNRVIIMGNLTRDPESRQLASGQSLCRFGLASNRQFKNRQTGATTQEVCFVDIEVWGAQAEICKKYLQKGKSVLVEGRLRLESWQDNEGKNRSKHSITADRITFLGSGPGADENSSYGTTDDASYDGSGMSDSSSLPTTDASSLHDTNMDDMMGFAKKASPKKKNLPKISPKGEVALSNEDPFIDEDLPF